MTSGPFSPAGRAIDLTDERCLNVLRKIKHPIFVSTLANDLLVQTGQDHLDCSGHHHATGQEPWAMMLPACSLEQLGDPSFCRDFGIRYPYIGGSMAKGISSVCLVQELGRAGMLGFFGSAGLPIDEVDAAIQTLMPEGLSEFPFGFNLIHSPSEPKLEDQLIDLYLKRNVHLLEASAFLDLTLPLVRYRTHGIARDASGKIVTPNRIMAKVSREEIATKFFTPPPAHLLSKLVEQGTLTPQQATWAKNIPMAQDITVEADSGGHTDNRPALSLFPTILALKEAMQQQHQYDKPLRVGLGGGISTPASAAAALAMGAAYLVTGTVNQACIESGTSDEVRQMLAETRQADITMAPSGDMFEMGVQVQVIKRGTMFPMRAAHLYALYRQYDSLDALPLAERNKLEQTVFKTSFETIWQQTSAYFSQRDPQQLIRAEAEPKHRMALVFRWYLGQSPVWANRGDSSRRMDYQIWCGPAMGAFNEWVKGSFLEKPSERQVVCVAMNILFGAVMVMRQQLWTIQGFHPNIGTGAFAPRPLEELKEFLS